MKEIIKLSFGLWFFAVLVSAAAWAEDGVNYPDVWERVLPEEVRTNIANYGDRSGLSQWLKENTNMADYAVSVRWSLEDAYHVDGEKDDVILRFADSWRSRAVKSESSVFYYSFFGDRLLSKDGKNRFPLDSNVVDILPGKSSVQRLSYTTRYINKDKAERYNIDISKYIFPPKLTLSNDMIYDGTHRYDRHGWSCADPITDITPFEFNSYKKGVHFLPAGYKEEDTGEESSWFLVQGLEQPRLITKKCVWGSGSLRPTDVYRYHEFSILRTSDTIIPLPDGTFLFVATRGAFPVFHIPRLKSDMSIPASISKRYKWLRHKDLFGIVNLVSFGNTRGSNKVYPLAQDSYPHCTKVDENGYCREIEGDYIYYDNLSKTPRKSDGFSLYSGVGRVYRINLALRDYVRGSYEIYHCNEGDKVVPGTIPCDERKEN